MGLPGYADEHIRLHVQITVRSARCPDPGTFRVQGTPWRCLRQLQLEALRLTGWQQAARLLPKTDFATDAGAAVSAEDLYSASTYNAGRLELELCPPRDAGDTLCSWLGPAVRHVQRLWRAKLRFRLRADIQDLVGTFKLMAEARQAHFVNADVLAGRGGRAAESYPLALAAAATGYLPPATARTWFRSLSRRAAVFCLRAGAVYLQALCGLNCLFHYLPALQELTRSFLKKLGPAFPWFQDPAHMQHGCVLAQAAAESHVKRSRKQSHFPPFETEVWSAVMIWALQGIDDAFSALERHFSDDRLRKRFEDLPRLAEILHKALNSIRSAVGPQLVCASYSADDAAVSILHVLRPGENFGNLLRTGSEFFGMEHAQLLLSSNQDGFGEPLQPEELMETLGQEGIFLSLLVRPYSPDLSSLEHQISEVAKVVGSNFSLQRAEHVLHLWSECEATAGQAGSCSCRILLPEHGLYSKESQYYHMYLESSSSMLTLRCNSRAFLAWVRETYGGDLGAGTEADAPEAPEASSLMSEIQAMQGQVDGWLKSRWAANLRSRSCCSFGSLPGLQTSRRGAVQNVEEPSALSGQSGASSSSDSVASKQLAKVEGALESPPKRSELRDFFGGSASWGMEQEGCSGSSSGSSSDPFRRQVEQTCAEEESPDERTWQLSQQYFAPEVLRPATIGAAACATALMTIPPHTARVVSQVLATVGDGRVMIASGLNSVVSSYVAGLSGGLVGAAVGGAAGPLGAVVGSVVGATAGGESAKWMAAQSQIVDFSHLKHYRYYTSAADGHQYLSHRATVQAPGAELLVLIVLVQAGTNGVRNLWSYANGQMSGQDMAMAFGRDLRDGVIVSTSAQVVLKALQWGQGHAAGSWIASLSATTLSQPVPVLMAVLTGGLLASQCLRYSMGTISLEQLRANSVLAATVSGAGIATNVVCIGLHLPFVSCALLTCTASNLAGLWAYEAWRAGKQDALEDKLLALARDVFGVGPGHTQRSLDRRWRVLARMAHPDKNRRHDAKTTFALLRLCKEVLEMRAAGSRVREPALYESFVSLSQQLPTWLRDACRVRT